MTAQKQQLPLAVCDVFLHLLQWNLAFSLCAVIFLDLSIHVDVHDMFCYELLNKSAIGFVDLISEIPCLVAHYVHL